jgi:hypothetical protein
MYENDKSDNFEIELGDDMNNYWRMRNEWPAIIGRHGDGLSLFILVISIVPTALIGSLPITMAFYYLIYANILHFKKITTKELFVLIKHKLNSEKINVPSHRQSSFFFFPLLIVLFFSSDNLQAVEIIKAKENNVAIAKEDVIGDFFIENNKPVQGHGDVDIETLLDVLITKRLDYKVIYDDSEIAEMLVSWRSLPPRELTLDQILGSLSVRYGVYFYTTRGSQEIHVAWLRDTAECKKRDGVYLRLCGTDAGKY